MKPFTPSQINPKSRIFGISKTSLAELLKAIVIKYLTAYMTDDASPATHVASVTQELSFGTHPSK